MIFTDLRIYQNLIETFLSKEGDRLEEHYTKSNLQKELDKVDERDKNQYYEFLTDRQYEVHNQMSKQFPHNFRASFLMQIISVIEYELKRICTNYGDLKGQLFTVDTLKGSDDLDKCKNYLKLIGRTNIIFDSTDWKFIKDCKLVRNAIVHHDSSTSKNNQHLISFLENHTSFSLLESFESPPNSISFLIINQNFIKELLNTAESILLEVV